MCFDIILNNIITNVLTYDLRNTDIFMHNLMMIYVLKYGVKYHVDKYALYNVDWYPWTLMINVYNRNIKYNRVLNVIIGIECCTKITCNCGTPKHGIITV